MRNEFVQTESRKFAKNACPWASVITKVDGGYMAFESTQDYRAWRSQK